MTAPRGKHAQSGAAHTPPARDDATIGELVSEITSGLSQLVRSEIALAKTELKEEGTKTGKAAALYGGAVFAAGLALVLSSLAAVHGLAHVMDDAWAALVIAAVWAVVGVALYTTGRSRMRTVQLTPERSIDSLKEDAKWAGHPTS